MKTRVTDLMLYRWRYVISYSIIIAAISSVIAIASLYVPGGLRQAEIDTALQSGSLSTQSIDPRTVINLPYHILQRLCFMMFGVTTVSIKLPSIILGVLTSIGIFLLIRTWFRRNIAILTTILATTTAHFLFLVQDGTPAILFSFLAIWILFAATYVTRKKLFGTFWKALTGVLMATALYVPLGIYLVLAILTTAFFHPHIRHVLTRFARPRLIIAVILGFVAITPLVYASIIDYHVALRLLGLADSPINLLANIKQVAHDLFGFLSPPDDYLLQPIYSLGLVLLILVGCYKLVTYKHTARSYITLLLAGTTIPIIIFNPIHIHNLFPLAVLMVALGVATLITDWYKLFPRNPYARVVGLFPLGLLIGGIVLSGVLRYMNNYEYNPEVLRNYSSDLRLLSNQLDYERADRQTTRFVVTKAELPFYNLVAHYDKRFAASTDATTPPKVLIMSHAVYHTTKQSNEPSLIVTNRRANDADRLYIYRQ